MNQVAAIILAAGKGTRIKATSKNKILLTLANKPMIAYTSELLAKLDISLVIFVVGFKKQDVKKFLGTDFTFINQGKLLGTGDAVKKAIKHLPRKINHTIVLYGDHSAFYKPYMIKNLIKRHLKGASNITFLSVEKKDPSLYGRIIRDGKGKVLAIREEKDATDKEKEIKEINLGAYCFSVEFLREYLPRIKKNPIKKEYYLTDLVELALRDNLPIEAMKLKDEAVSYGVNTLEDLAKANRLMRKRLKV